MPATPDLKQTSIRLSTAASTACSDLIAFFQCDPSLMHLGKTHILNLAIFYIHEMSDAEIFQLDANVADKGKKTSGTPLRMRANFYRQYAKPLIERVSEMSGRSKGVTLSYVVTKGILALWLAKEEKPLDFKRTVDGLKKRQRALKLGCC